MTYLDGEPSEFGSGGGPGLTGSRSLSDTDTAATDGRSNRAGRLGDASTGGLDSSGPTDRATPAERREFDDTTASERQTEQVRTLARALERPSEADRVVEPLYRAIERKYRIERERRGL